MDEPSEAELLQQDETEPAAELSWHASEFEYHDKKAGWYMLFGLGFVVLVAVAVITKQWLTIGVFGVMAAALLVYANRKPRDLQYSLDDDGVTIDDKHYEYEQFESFAMVQDEGWRGIDLDPVRRFMPRISLSLEEGQEEEVAIALSAHLPRIDRAPDLIERWTRRLKF